MAQQDSPSTFDRRRFLTRTGAVAGAAVAASLLVTGEAGATPSGRPAAGSADLDPDQLFWDGRFAEADGGYAEILRTNPSNAHALAQRGYIAAMANRFPQAEWFLTKAIRLAPDDDFSKDQLAGCFVRQGELDRAVPLLRGTANDAYATLYASVTGTPCQLRGAQATRLPFLNLDPLPMVEASINAGPLQRFVLDTGAPMVLSMAAAKQAGLRAVATVQGGPPGMTTTQYLGVADSIRLGGIELRNVPLLWGDGPIPAPPGDPQPAGVIGTWIFYQFITTMDYANQALVLRRKTPAQVHNVRTEARRAGAGALPLWLALDHVPFTVGSINGYGPGMARLDTGAAGLGVIMTEQKAKDAGVTIDYAHPIMANGSIMAYPITAQTMTLGNAEGHNLPGIAGPISIDGQVHFQTLADFAHEFFKPFTITFDYADMNFYIAPGARATP